MFSKKCRAHYKENNMTAWQHFCFAGSLLIEIKKIEIALFIHLLMPRFCQTYASDKIKELTKLLESK